MATLKLTMDSRRAQKQERNPIIIRLTHEWIKNPFANSTRLAAEKKGTDMLTHNLRFIFHLTAFLDAEIEAVRYSVVLIPNLLNPRHREKRKIIEIFGWKNLFNK